LQNISKQNAVPDRSGCKTIYSRRSDKERAVYQVAGVPVSELPTLAPDAPHKEGTEANREAAD